MAEFPPLPPMPDDPFSIVTEGRAALQIRRAEKALWVIKERHGQIFQPPTASTIADYKRDVERLMKRGHPWEEATKTTKIKTWLKRKSALLAISEKEIERLLKEQDRLQRVKKALGTAEFQQWVTVLEQLHTYTAILVTRPPMQDPKNPQAKIIEILSKKASKRRIGNLPDDWREMLVARMQKWRPQALVCAVTGCRPSEITAGVQLLVKDGKLIAKVAGKKCGLYSGQELRSMTWPITDTSPLVGDLAKMVIKAGGQLTVDYSGHKNTNPAKALSAAMTQAGKRAFPGHKVSLTPYSLRHAAASDLKASDLLPEDISKALGHQAINTQSTYGSRQQGNGSLAPIQVKAPKDVRGSRSELLNRPVASTRKAAKVGVRPSQ